MTLSLDLPEMPALDLVALLADPHRAFRAYTRLLALGPEATEAARAGLAHPDERVRERCCQVLDHLMDADSIPLLIGALADPCERVRIAAVHALACDRCKTDSCRPAPEAVLPTAVDLLADDPSALVRAYAAELVGQLGAQPAGRPRRDHPRRRPRPVAGGQEEGILVRPGRTHLPPHPAAARVAPPDIVGGAGAAVLVSSPRRRRRSRPRTVSAMVRNRVLISAVIRRVVAFAARCPAGSRDGRAAGGLGSGEASR